MKDVAEELLSALLVIVFAAVIFVVVFVGLKYRNGERIEACEQAGGIAVVNDRGAYVDCLPGGDQ